MRRVLWLLACLLLCLAGCSPIGQDRPPTAMLEASSWEGFAPLEVTFSALESMDDHGIAAVTWDFGDGEIRVSEGFTMTHIFAAPGNYPVRVVVIDTQGATDEALGTVIIANREPIANFRATNDAPVTGEIVWFDASASHDPDGDPLSYEWSFGGSPAFGESVSHRFARIGLILVTLTVEDGHGGRVSTSHEFNVLDPGAVIGGGCGG
ncbi:PKD domain-containing protein [Candidatus Bipolaricaulota bacterium]|nr:PKD domain-containing protein [Candidatus Bipolaricaulota bacterium]